MPKGIIWVSSRLSHPPAGQTRPGVSPLTSERFCDWYENTHIQEVTALGGMPGAVRWEAVHPQPSPRVWSVAAPWLTVYEMPDIAYRNTTAFKGLDGQSNPRDVLLHEIFEQAQFDTRFYEEYSLPFNASLSSAPARQARYLLSWASDASDAGNAFAGIEGVERVRRFGVVAGTTLERFVRRDAAGEGGVRGELVLVEFEEGAMDVVKGIVREKEKEEDEVGWFLRKRGYGEK